MEKFAPLDLKVNLCTAAELQRNNFVFHNGSIWKCTNKSIFLFQEIESKVVSNIDQPTYQRLETLQLVPLKWKV